MLNTNWFRIKKAWVWELNSLPQTQAANTVLILRILSNHAISTSSTASTTTISSTTCLCRWQAVAVVAAGSSSSSSSKYQ